YDPQKNAQLNTMILSAKERNDAHLEAIKLWTDGKPQDSFNTALAAIDPKAPDAPAQWAQVQKTYRGMGMDPGLLATAGDFSPENHARVTRAAIGPTKGAELAQTAANQAHSPAYKEWQDYQAQGGTLDFNAYQTMDANRKAATVRVNTGQG